MTFGERLRQLRKDKKLTLRGLAEAAGVDFTYLSKIENDKAGYLPAADTIRALATILGVDRRAWRWCLHQRARDILDTSHSEAAGLRSKANRSRQHGRRLEPA